LLQRTGACNRQFVDMASRKVEKIHDLCRIVSIGRLSMMLLRNLRHKKTGASAGFDEFVIKKALSSFFLTTCAEQTRSTTKEQQECSWQWRFNGRINPREC